MHWKLEYIKQVLEMFPLSVLPLSGRSKMLETNGAKPALPLLHQWGQQTAKPRKKNRRTSKDTCKCTGKIHRLWRKSWQSWQSFTSFTSEWLCLTCIIAKWLSFGYFLTRWEPETHQGGLFWVPAFRAAALGPAAFTFSHLASSDSTWESVSPRENSRENHRSQKIKSFRLCLGHRIPSYSHHTAHHSGASD